MSCEIYALVVQNAEKKSPETEVLRVLAAKDAPRGAEELEVDTMDFAALVSRVHGGLQTDRGETVLRAYIMANNPNYAGRPGAMIRGRSHELARALTALGALHGRHPLRPVLCTGQLSPEGKIEEVEWLPEKIDGALRWCPQHSEGEQGVVERPLLLIPAGSWTDKVSTEKTLRDFQRDAQVAGVELREVSTFWEAASCAFGVSFFGASGALGVRLGELQSQLRAALYDTNYIELLVRAEELLEVVCKEPKGAPIRRLREREVKAIARWAAERLISSPPSQSLSWLGREVSAGELKDRLNEELKEAENNEGTDQTVSEIEALIFNLDASQELKATTHVQRGLEWVARGLSLPGLVDHPAGERRKLIGTRAQLRRVAGLRARSLGAKADADWHLDGAVEDAALALKYAQGEGVKERNDRARVRVYLADALFTRSGEGDDVQALDLLRQVLGLDGELSSVEAPHQEPGWALRVLYLFLRRRGPRQIVEHWRRVGAHLHEESSFLGLSEAMAERLDKQKPMIHDGAIASLVALDAARQGEIELARSLLSHAPRETMTLREFVWWWPLLGQSELRDAEALATLRRAAGGEGTRIQRPEGPSRDLVVDELLERMRVGAEIEAWAAWRRLSMWIGDDKPQLGPPSLSVCQLSPALLARVHLSRGETASLSALPDGSVALDGYVLGPQIDAARRRFSFDHHGDCVRHATLSSCEMTLDALRVGLSVRDLEIYLNDLDADAVLSAWLILRPEAALDPAVVKAVREVGRMDALGPASPSAGVPAALSWALSAVLVDIEGLRSASLAKWREVLALCLARLDAWWAAGAPESDPRMPPPIYDEVSMVLIHDGGHWRLVSGGGGLGTLYASGCLAGVVHRPLVDGSHHYTLGKANEFVGDFDVPALLQALALEERRVNPTQAAAHNWGGGSTIGGSPRNLDGSASTLKPAQVAAVIASCQGV